MKTAKKNTSEPQRKPSLTGWSPLALRKSLFHELLSKAVTLAPGVYDEFLVPLSGMVNRTRPVRLSKCGRYLRAWGRNYEFDADEALLVKRIIKAHRDGIRKVSWPGNALDSHPAVEDGIIQHSKGCYWLQEPPEEINKPVQVMFTADSDPYASVDKEALALAYLTMYPEWTNDQIADKIGVARTSVYRFEKFRAARAVLKEGRQDFKDWQQIERGGKDSTRAYTRRQREEKEEN